MAKVNLYRCDICQKEHREENHWYVCLERQVSETEADRHLKQVCNSCGDKINACITGSQPAAKEKE